MGEWPSLDLLTHRRRATPDSLAVIDAAGGAEYSYRDIDDAVAWTARALAEYISTASENGRPRIGIGAEPSPRFAIAIHAVWRTGAVAVPLSPTQPVGDRRSRLDRLDLSLGLETGTSAFESVEPGCPVISLESATVAGAESSSPARWRPDETALILFTSGTTGSPKGVRLTHRNLVASAIGSAFRLGVHPDDRWHTCLPPHHMGGLAPLVRATIYGTAVVMERDFDADETPDRMADHAATAISVVPTMVRRLLDRDWTPHDELATVLCGGAPTPPDLVDEALDADLPLFPTYGTTETASQIATARPSAAAANPHSVGSPLLTADVTIVDPDEGTPLDTGEVGELVVDGPVVTPGYLDATSPVDEFGLHTGDLASRGASGRLEIHGRLDDAIQTGGETVHPARVTAALRTLPNVRDAVVVGVPDAEWGERVAALVEMENGHSIDLEDLRRAVDADLAPHELPQAVRTVDSLPRTPSGTIDRSAARSKFRAGGPDA